MMVRTLPRTAIWLLSLSSIFLALLAAAPVRAAPTDTPTTVVNDPSLEEWAVGAGLVYWANSCYADEFNPFATLKRKPVSGGTERTLEAINDYARCITYLTLLSSDDGLYYFDSSQERIARMPLGEPYTAQTVKALTASQFPNVGKPLIEANGYLYWASYPNKIYRLLKNGSGEVETVADTATSVSDVMVVGNTVYWTDSTGIWTISIGCATLPCAETKDNFTPFGPNTAGYGLLYQVLGSVGPATNYRVYWVQRITSGPNNTYEIRYKSCNTLVSCDDPVITPGAASAAPDTSVVAAEAQSPQETQAVIVFYASTVNWRIGNPVLANGNVYWTEMDTALNSTTGDVKRKPASQTTPGADTIATSQSKIDDQLYVANNTLYFSRRYTGIYSLSLNASAIVRDFSAEGVEVTQGIQNLANSAPLVANKTTYVRVYGKQLAGPSTPNVEARLIGTRNGLSLPGSPLRPINPVRALTTGGSYDRARLNDGWYFLLPASWLAAGNITLQAEVDPRRIHTDPNLANNTRVQAVSFQSQPPVCVWTVPVRTHTPLPSTTDPNFWSMVNQFNRRWPVPETWIYRDTDPVEELQVCWYGPFPHPCYGPYELEDGWGITNGPPDRDKVIVSLWGRALLSFNPDACDNIGAPVHFMGMVHPNANNGGASGYASTVSNQSWVQLPDHTPNPMPAGWDQMREGSTMAQELAHNHGRKHVNCGNPDNVDNSYPYPPCQIANTGADSYYGFDIATQRPIRPDQAADFMSYGGRTWVSDYTWRALFNSFVATGVAAAAPQSPAEGNSVFVTGLVDAEHNRGEITMVLVLPTDSVPPATRQRVTVQAAGGHHDEGPHAIFKLRLLDAGGNLLIERVLTLTELDDHSEESHAALFSDLFAQPAGQVATIQLLADDTVIDTLTPGINPPTVAVQQPAAGTLIDNALTIQWTATDSDPDDRLLFTVQYSHDNGASWHTLAVNLPGTPDPTNTLALTDLGSLHGSAPNAALIRVLASDGYNTTIATSAPFTLKNRLPQPVISAPSVGQTFAAGQTILLQGSATDAEDGGLPATSLTWQVNSLPLGSGTDLSVAGLAPGAHTVTLAATDTNSQTATASATFTIAPLSVPLATTPTLDGFCEDEAYATGSSLDLKPYSDGTQASVRILRSSDALWACFSGLKPGAADPGAFVGLGADLNTSRDAQVQTTDVGFFVGEDGDVFTQVGDNAGGFVSPGPAGLQGQVSAGAESWSAELRIDATALNGWDHLIGLSAGHYAVSAPGDHYLWPHTAAGNQPNTWATTALGSQPVLTAIAPYTATVLSASFPMTVEGSGFVSGTVVLWNDVPLATTFIDGEHLVAQVAAANLSSAALVQITARAPAPATFVSNALPFVVEAATPVITNLSPSSASAGQGTLTVTITGNNFAANAQVLWNGTPLPTQVVSPTQLTAQIDGALLANGQEAGIAVRNAQPSEQISPAATFTVEPNVTTDLYLPLITR